MKQVINFNNKNWPLPGQPIDDNFYFEALASSTVGLRNIAAAWTTFQYSTDKQNWTNCTTATSLSLSTGDKVYFRAKQTGDTPDDDNRNTHFNITGNVKAAGNIMWLYDYENPQNMTTTYTCAFAGLFSSSATGLTDVSELIMPTVLSPGCCINMFLSSCITSSPVLAAPVLSERCYFGMFALTSTIIDITMLATDISATDCLGLWLWGSPNTSNQTLYKNANISTSSFSRGDSGIPSNWNVEDYQG